MIYNFAVIVFERYDNFIAEDFVFWYGVWYVFV